MIVLDKISKIYRAGFFYRRVPAVENVSFRVNKAEVFGFIGANGAGKTTIIKIILGLSPPTSGRGTLVGYPLGAPEGRRDVGFLPENPYFPPDISVWDYLAIAARMKRIPKDRIEAAIAAKLKKLGMFEARRLKFGECSKGMVQRAGIAFALLGDPKLIILDEPMSGLDPQGRFEVQRLIRREREKGNTVFFSSHIMSDVEQVCDRVGLMVEGNLRGVFLASEFMAESEDDIISVHLKGVSDEKKSELKTLDPLLDEKAESLFLTLRGHGAVLKLLETLKDELACVVSILPERRGLERHFYKKPGKNLPDKTKEKER
ncbi:MAG: hypothetical protein Kow0090_18380 [Myxococcota bacterium]